MKYSLLLLFLTFSSVFALVAVLTASPRKMILSWLAVGIFQSAFLLVIGFELVSLLNMFFVVGSATVLKLFSSLYGSEETRRVEAKITARNWIYGMGQTLTLGLVLALALSEVVTTERFLEEIDTKVFAAGMMEKFPELPWVLGFVLFLTIVIGSTVGRPAWKKVQGVSE